MRERPVLFPFSFFSFVFFPPFSPSLLRFPPATGRKWVKYLEDTWQWQRSFTFAKLKSRFWVEDPWIFTRNQTNLKERQTEWRAVNLTHAALLQHMKQRNAPPQLLPSPSRYAGGKKECRVGVDLLLSQTWLKLPLPPLSDGKDPCTLANSTHY